MIRSATLTVRCGVDRCRLVRRTHSVVSSHVSNIWTISKRAYSSSSGKATGVDTDPIFQIAASNLRFGPGATSEVGQDLVESYQCRTALVVTDANIRTLSCFSALQDSLKRSNVDYVIFDQVRIEPNDQSFFEAIRFAKATQYDAVVAMGGGSIIDTAKAANLYASHPNADFWDFVNAPIGKGLPIPGPVKPLIAVPTTSGTGSETTGVAIFDTTRSSWTNTTSSTSSDRPLAPASKTGIADRRLKPALGIIDPNNTVDQPALVTLYTGLDVLCHALESYTALPSSKRSPRPVSPLHRPAYQGSNPISDAWSLFAIQTVAEHLKAASKGDADSLFQMMIAASAAGMGFGNAGVHLCHGMSYAVSAQVKDTVQPLYHHHHHQSNHHPLIPHGLSVIVNAPTVFEYTESADEDRHDTCSYVLGYDSTSLSHAVRNFCEDHLGVKTGLAQFGYTKEDVPQLVEATMAQHRVLKVSPRPVEPKDMERLFTDAIES
jgi:hydroxyacid-oxoacid transhydrogenase